MPEQYPQLVDEFRILGLTLDRETAKSRLCVFEGVLVKRLTELAPGAGEFLGEDPVQFRESVTLRCEDAWSPDCHVEPESRSISIAHGFMLGLYNSSALLLARQSMHQQDPRLVRPLTVAARDDLRTRYATLVRAIASGSILPRVRPISMLTDPAARIDVACVLRWAEGFALAHEIGHVIAANPRANGPFLRHGYMIVGDSIGSSALHGLIPGGTQVRAREWAIEFACDAIALTLLMALTEADDRSHSFAQNPGAHPMGPPIGASVTLTLLDAVESTWSQAAELKRAQQAFSRHPPALTRFRALHEWDSNLGHWSQADLLCDLSQDLGQGLLGPLPPPS